MNINHPGLSVNRQLKLLNLPHSSHYYKPQVRESRKEADAQVKDTMQNIYLEKPFYGVLRMTEELNNKGFNINHKHVSRLHKELGLQTIYPHAKLNTSLGNPESQTFPYLLRGVPITHYNQVWSIDITYTKVNGHNAYIIAIIDWYSRMVLLSKTVNSMDTCHCIELVEQAIKLFGTPEIFNSDQGSQFTSREFTDTLKRHKIQISMDGRGRCRDNARMERFWWSLKVENLWINSYTSMDELRCGVEKYIKFYNTVRLHSALGYKTPKQVYESSQTGGVA